MSHCIVSKNCWQKVRRPTWSESRQCSGGACRGCSSSGKTNRPPVFSSAWVQWAQELWSWCYCDSVKLNHLVFFQIKCVVQLCSQYLESALDLENCVDVLSLADTFSLQKLKPQVFIWKEKTCENCDNTQVLRFMSENLSQLTGEVDWTSIYWRNNLKA